MLVSKYLQSVYVERLIQGTSAPSSAAEVSGSSMLVASLTLFRFGRSPVSPSTFPQPAASEPVKMLNGVPERKTVVPEIVQPPKSRESQIALPGRGNA